PGTLASRHSYTHLRLWCAESPRFPRASAADTSVESGRGGSMDSAACPGVACCTWAENARKVSQLEPGSICGPGHSMPLLVDRSKFVSPRPDRPSGDESTGAMYPWARERAV